MIKIDITNALMHSLPISKAMLAWQTVNAVRYPNSKRFT
jgi:hypothetical protein